MNIPKIKNLKSLVDRRIIRRGIGIHIRKDHIYAVQMECDNGSFRIVRRFSTPLRRKDDTCEAQIRDLFKTHKFNRCAAVTLGLDPNQVYLRSLGSNREALASEAGSEHKSFANLFPISQHELVTALLPDDRDDDSKASLVAATSLTAINNILSAFHHASLRTPRIATPLLSIYHACAFNHPQINSRPAVLAHATESHLNLAIIKDSQIRLTRSLPLECCEDDEEYANSLVSTILLESQPAWEKVFSSGMPPETNIFLVDENLDTQKLSKTLQQKYPERSIYVTDFGKFICRSGQSHENMHLAEALAYCALRENPNDTNWLALAKKQTTQSLDFRKELKIIGSLAAGVAIAVLLALWLHVGGLQNRYEVLNSRINETFSQALPDESVVKPLAQMEQRLQRLRENSSALQLTRGGHKRMLSLFHHIVSTMPSDHDIEIKSFSIDHSRVHIEGVAETFNSLDAWQQALLTHKMALDVKTDYLKNPDTTDHISFNLDIELDKANHYAQVNL